MAKKCARTFSIVVEKGKKSILDVSHLLPGGIARSVHEVPRRAYHLIEPKPVLAKVLLISFGWSLQ